MLDNLKADFKRYAGTPSTLKSSAFALTEYGLWATAVYRFGRWVREIRLGLVRKPLMAIYFILYKMIEIFFGIRISIMSEIGPGLLIHNFGGIVIRGRMGRNCVLVQGAQLLSKGNFRAAGWPTLGDNVYVGAGAKVLGAVTVGDNVRIGANAVVTTNIAPYSVVLPPESLILEGYYLRKPPKLPNLPGYPPPPQHAVPAEPPSE